MKPQIMVAVVIILGLSGILRTAEAKDKQKKRVDDDPYYQNYQRGQEANRKKCVDQFNQGLPLQPKDTLVGMTFNFTTETGFSQPPSLTKWVVPVALFKNGKWSHPTGKEFRWATSYHSPEEETIAVAGEAVADDFGECTFKGTAQKGMHPYVLLSSSADTFQPDAVPEADRKKFSQLEPTVRLLAVSRVSGLSEFWYVDNRPNPALEAGIPQTPLVILSTLKNGKLTKILQWGPQTD